MNVEKVKNYNQKLLAVLGTVGLIFLLTALIAFISIMVIEIFPRSYDESETGILSDEKIEELQKENKRKQVISYQMPKLIDTINSVYIIPVSHKTLDDKEDINRILNIHSPILSDDYEDVDTRYSLSFYGAFNNLIVFDQKADTTYKLFQQRANFNEIKTCHFPDDILLLFKVAEKDTYKDGVINLMDFKSLYIYSLREKTLKKIENEGTDVFDYRFLKNSKDLVMSFGTDKNSDGNFKEYNEPVILKKYHYKTGKLSDIIDQNTNAELQKMLEGTKD